MCRSIRMLDGYVSLAFFFFNDTATTEIYTLSLHDALPICDEETKTGRVQHSCHPHHARFVEAGDLLHRVDHGVERDRKSTRLNSSHLVISYAAFSLKKKQDSHAPSVVILLAASPRYSCGRP